MLSPIMLAAFVVQQVTVIVVLILTENLSIFTRIQVGHPPGKLRKFQESDKDWRVATL